MASQTIQTFPHISTREKIEAIKLAGGQVPVTLTEADLKQHLPQLASEAPSSNEPKYTCITQVTPDPSSPAAILVHTEGGKVPRWKAGSVINFATYADGYPAPGDAIYAANCLIAAAKVWNDHKVGVFFKWVSNVEDAAFVLAYGNDLGGVLASAFFPNGKGLETMFVYKSGFDKTRRESRRGPYNHYDILTNVFLHELGHVLGLRHEFALTPGPRYEGGAIVLGEANEDSVMNYVFPPEIQPSDVRDTRLFYNYPVIVDYVPDN